MDINLLLVDDEDLTREGLFHYVDWSGLGITHIQAASNGVQALKLAEAFPPDILLTDIRMPHMSGIELARRIREHSPACHILFISGYAEKEYLKSAIDLKVEAYIDKPATPDSVSHAVAQASEAIKQEREKERCHMLLVRNLCQAEDIVRDRVAQTLIRKKIDWKQFHTNFTPSYFTWPEHGTYYTVCLRLMAPGFPSYPYADCCRIRDYWKTAALFDEKEYYSGVMEHLCIFYLVMTDSPARVQEASEKLQQWIRKEYQTDSRAVIGPCAHSLEDLSDSCQAAVLELECACFYDDRPSLIVCRSAPAPKSAPAALFTQELPSGEHLLSLFDQLYRERFTDIEQLRYRLYELYLYRLRENPGGCACSFDAFRSLPFPEIQKLLTSRTLENVLPQDYENCDPKIRQAIQYVSSHYGDEKLSVKMIADQVELSQNYFCTLFKQNCDMTVNDFIIRVRISQAKYLLKNTNLKLYEISRQIGIPDANYLNILFKKTCHMTPSQYRRET